MSIDLRTGTRGWRRVETSCGKLKYRVDLLLRDFELLNNVAYAGSGFEVFEHGGYRHPSIAKYPCAPQSARPALPRGALVPITNSHVAAVLSGQTRPQPS